MRTLVLAILATGFGTHTLAGERRIDVDTVVAAPRTDCWHAWTTRNGLKTFIVEDAKVELTPGGAYEWYFSTKAPEGQRGGEGCKILFLDPMSLIAFSWNAPPKIPALRNSGAQTQVFVRFDEIDPNKTKVSLTQLVPESGADWDQYYAYFQKAWPAVMAQLKTAMEKPDRNSAPAAALDPTSRSEQTFELDFPPALVYRAFTDPRLAKKWVAPQVDLDLKVGGKFNANYNPAAAPGDDRWIVREILGFEPNRALAMKMLKAPANFPHKQSIEGTYSIIYFDAAADGKTRLRIVAQGLRNDEATKKMRDFFEKANPTVVENLKRVLAEERGS